MWTWNVVVRQSRGLTLGRCVSLPRYPDYREPPWSENKYEYTAKFWHILAAQFIFVVVFEVNIGYGFRNIIFTLINLLYNLHFTFYDNGGKRIAL